MDVLMMLATTRRVLEQLRHDHRSIAMILVVPALLLTAVYFLYENETLPPGAPRTFDRVGTDDARHLPVCGDVPGHVHHYAA
jgi:ABC-2 type transport system permease protein